MTLREEEWWKIRSEVATMGIGILLLGAKYWVEMIQRKQYNYERIVTVAK
jgi:hypothetical protein